jgi:hypothetical protein
MGADLLTTSVPNSGNQIEASVLTKMDDHNLQAASERSLVVVTLGTVSLVAFLGLLASTS